jgi:hypothetical protein
VFSGWAVGFVLADGECLTDCKEPVLPTNLRGKGGIATEEKSKAAKSPDLRENPPRWRVIRFQIELEKSPGQCLGHAAYTLARKACQDYLSAKLFHPLKKPAFA